jgi:hypothetical protein
VLFDEKYQKLEDLPIAAKEELTGYLSTVELYELEIGYDNYETGN